MAPKKPFLTPISTQHFLFLFFFLAPFSVWVRSGGCFDIPVRIQGVTHFFLQKGLSDIQNVSLVITKWITWHHCVQGFNELWKICSLQNEWTQPQIDMSVGDNLQLSEQSPAIRKLSVNFCYKIAIPQVFLLCAVPVPKWLTDYKMTCLSIQWSS